MAEGANRVVSDSMIGLQMPDIACWSGRVSVVLGQNPGPFTGPGTNTYLIGTGAERLLLDTGQGRTEYVPLLERALRETPGGDVIQEIVVTHSHPDHVGGVESLRVRFGELRILKKPRAGHDDGLPLIGIDEGTEIYTEGATLRALWTPGHACDHLCFYLLEERALFSGDMVLGAGTTVVPRDGDLGDYLASLRRLLELDLDVIYPAHGPKITNPRQKIEAYLAHRALRDSQILDGLKAGETSVAGLVARIYSDVPSFLHDAAGVSVEAHLRNFQREGRVRNEDGRWLLVR